MTIKETVLERFCELKRPEQDPWFPEDLTKTSEESLGRLLHLYTLWKNYASQQYSFIDAELHIVKEELKIKQAEELVNLNADDELKKEYSAKEDRIAYVTGKLKELIVKVSNLTAQSKMEEAIVEIMSDRYSVVSRELTRRLTAYRN